MNAQGMVAGAGGIAFVGSFAQAKGFPSNGYAVIAGTTALVFLVGLAPDRLNPLLNAFAGLMLLVAVIRYIPGIVNRKAK